VNVDYLRSSHGSFIRTSPETRQAPARLASPR
jgi:hypothetical protein